MHRLLFALALVNALALTAPAAASGLDDALTQPPVVSMQEDDAELVAAKREARRTLDQFMQRLRQKSPHDLDFAARVLVGDGPQAEAMWVSRLQRDGEWLVGRVDMAPLHGASGLETGALYRFKADAITDWTILEHTLRGERLLGGYTLKVQEAREMRGIVPDAIAFHG
jgi:uncharacterized protein YegJ (DUF2314 family)